MSTRLSIAMMAHHKREASVKRILASLDRKCPVVWDTCDDRHETGRRAMLAYDSASAWHAVIQDDVIPCRDLCAGLEEALRYVPDDVAVCGYAGRIPAYKREIDRALARHRGEHVSWLVMDILHWGPLIVVPTRFIPEMIDYYDSIADVPNYDRRISRYFHLVRKVQTWYTWPSVVEHDSGPSLVSGRGGGRRAHNFAGADVSALDICWDGAAVPVESPDMLRALRIRHEHPSMVQRPARVRHERQPMVERPQRVRVRDRRQRPQEEVT